MNAFAIEIDHVWKQFPLKKDNPGIKEFVLHLDKFIARKFKRNNHFDAIKDLSLKIKPGECVGIIGRNGAGKSTLLSLMLGTILPSKGRVKIRDRVTPLLELGAGFHPDLTGREDLILNGVLLGLTKKEILEKMSSIIAFSEIGEFVDSPVRTYSSGMQLRLAFSIAIHVEPKILIIDEVLSVGDEGFRRKSKEALLKLIKGGVTTVLVSHNLEDMEKICGRVLCLDRGELIADGNPREVIEIYQKEFVQSGK